MMDPHRVVLVAEDVLFLDNRRGEVRSAVLVFKIFQLVLAECALRTTAIKAFRAVVYLLLGFDFVRAPGFVALVARPKNVRSRFLHHQLVLERALL